MDKRIGRKMYRIEFGRIATIALRSLTMREKRKIEKELKEFASQLKPKPAGDHQLYEKDNYCIFGNVNNLNNTITITDIVNKQSAKYALGARVH